MVAGYAFLYARMMYFEWTNRLVNQSSHTLKIVLLAGAANFFVRLAVSRFPNLAPENYQALIKQPFLQPMTGGAQNQS